ncbi:MAG: hypothetical protein K6A74_02520 [Lachnospiraceae bacterium]|nr:hypothetical protein [Lachnospiraceae bacterium]
MGKRTRFASKRLTAGLLAVFLAFSNFDLPAWAEGVNDTFEESISESVYEISVSDNTKVLHVD